MKLIAQIQLRPTAKQQFVLKRTLEIANTGCNLLSAYAWDNKEFGQYALHKALYHAVRTQFPLSAHVVVRCIAKVADAYKLDQSTKRVFKEHGAIAYDERILRYMTEKRTVSIWTMEGRQTIPFVCGDRQTGLLAFQQGESDLVYQRGKWYLLATCDLPDPTEDEVDRYLGIDRGLVNLATDSDGHQYQGEKVEENRKWYTNRRRVLQKRNTKSAKRRLRKIGNKHARFQKDVNHCISKQLVLNAKHTKRGIALEDLKGIHLRTRVRYEDRAARGNWGFAQLESFISYKARLHGVSVKLVDPAYTSQRCAACGHIEKRNRKSQSEFLCVKCGHTAHADVNAAVNVSTLAVVIQPNVLGATKAYKPTFRRLDKPRPSGLGL